MNKPRDLHFFLKMHTFFQELSKVLDRSVREKENRVRDKDRDSKRLKITFVFIRRYLGNWKSYRNK